MAVVNRTVIHIVVIDGFVFDRCHFSKMDGLQLMAIGQIGMVCRDNCVIMIVGFSGKDLVLGSSFKMVGSLAVVLGSCMVHLVFALFDL